MASITFVGGTQVPSTWLNEVNQFIYAGINPTGAWSSSNVSFTNVTVSGTYSIGSTVVTWSGNPTHSGNHTWDGIHTFNAAVVFNWTLTCTAAVTTTNTFTANGVNTFGGAATFNAAATFNVLPLGMSKTARKTVTTARTLNTTATVDPELSIVLPIGTYSIECWVTLWTLNTTTQGLLMGFGSSGGTCTWSNSYHGVINSVGATGFLAEGSEAGNPALTSYGNIRLNTFDTPNGADWLVFHGYVSVTAQTTFGVYWAQNTSSANPTKVGRDSYMVCVRLS